MGISTKIFGLVSVLLSIILLVGGISIFYMNEITHEITEIAEEDIPLVKILTDITVSQLEQIILFEKIFGIAISLDYRPEGQTELVEAKENFKELATLVTQEIKQAEKQAESGIESALEEEIIQKFKKVLGKLKVIEKKHDELNKIIFQSFTLIDQNNTYKIYQLENEVGIAASELNQDLKALLREIGGFTEQSLENVRIEEEEALFVIVIVFIVGVSLGLIFGFLLRRSVRRSLEEIQRMSTEVTSTSGAMAKNNNIQSSAIEETSTLIEELITTIQDVATNASNVASTANSSADHAKTGKDAVMQLLEAMGLISDSSQQITEIINVITDIAEQTNLLALNAAIEAARAGEEGKGFAVVADEVRKLAERSASSAQEITKLIKTSKARVDDGVELSNQAHKVLDAIVDYVEKTADSVEQISAATEEQASSSNEVKDQVNRVSAAMEENAAASEELASNAENMSNEIHLVLFGKVIRSMQPMPSIDEETKFETVSVVPNTPPSRTPMLKTISEVNSSTPSSNKAGKDYLDW